MNALPDSGLAQIVLGLVITIAGGVLLYVIESIVSSENRMKRFLPFSIGTTVLTGRYSRELFVWMSGIIVAVIAIAVLYEFTVATFLGTLGLCIGIAVVGAFIRTHFH